MPAASQRSRPPDLPTGVSLAAAAVALVAVSMAVNALSIGRETTAAAGAANLQGLWPLWIASGVSWLALTAVWWRLRVDATRPARGGVSGRMRAALVVLAVAGGVRGMVLVGHETSLSDDIHRFVFDGRTGAAGVNPYLVTPESRVGVADDDMRWRGEATRAARMNNPEMHTIYLPVSQWVFGAIGKTLSPAGDPARAERRFRLAFVLFEMIGIGLVLLALTRAGRSPWWATLYAWHPLALIEIAGSGHQDAIGLPLLVAGLLLASAKPERCRRWVWAIAAAALIKPFVVPAAAFVLRRSPPAAWGRALVIGIVVTGALGAPLLLSAGGAPVENLRATSERFALKWAHFGSVYEPLLTAIEWRTPAWGNDPQEQLARGICLLAFLIAGIIIWIRSRDAWRGMSALLLAMILLSPTAHPWYLLWALILLPMTRSRAVWVASLTLPWGYVVLADPVDWTVPAGVMVAAYVPIYAALLLDVGPGRPGRGDPSRTIAA
ncbi:MAG: hypothetical protein HKO59_08465 [Phycisphaerales bacterium]|nr:hypothetical protein [Phycisphaerales bacterium]